MIGSTWEKGRGGATLESAGGGTSLKKRCLRSRGSEGVRNSVNDRGNSKCKDPTWLSNKREATVARAK